MRRRGLQLLGGRSIWLRQFNGSQRGRKWEAHGRSLNGRKEKEGGEKSCSPAPEGPPRAPAPPGPQTLHCPNLVSSRESGGRPPCPSRCDPLVPSVLDTQAAADHARRCAVAARPVEASPPRWKLWAVAKRSKLLSWCQRSGRKLASTLGCQGPELRDGIASRVLPTLSAQMKGCGVSLLSM